ncbi:hypothetical protein HDA40_001827 [Hamadaea flava]|nr:hypothetical protein [Hamadaea flava]MCP2323320.1 hypothetical protein [Hamadaea flava]
MDELLRDDPLIPGVPSHYRHVSQCHIIDVNEYLVGALLVPDLSAGVARVGKDYADGAVGPGTPWLRTLPFARGVSILVSRGGDPPVERKPKPRIDLLLAALARDAMGFTGLPGRECT